MHVYIDELLSERRRSLGPFRCGRFETLPVPNMPCACYDMLPVASPVSRMGAGKQKAIPQDRSDKLIFLRKSGAGEGIRTLDPNLGKVAVGLFVSILQLPISL
jgi:hypothetical protein